MPNGNQKWPDATNAAAATTSTTRSTTKATGTTGPSTTITATSNFNAQRLAIEVALVEFAHGIFGVARVLKVDKGKALLQRHGTNATVFGKHVL